jgi:hypothetical protein
VLLQHLKPAHGVHAPKVLVLAMATWTVLPALTFAQAEKPASSASEDLATPRSTEGHPNLGSAPGHKGYWEVRPGLGGMPRAADVPFQPWAKALYQYRISKRDLYPPLVACKPASGPSFFNAPGFEIVDAPELKRMFILNIAGPHSWRVVYMDGRPHPSSETLRPTFFGHSIGHWDGDTLVIDTVGFNEKQWIAGAYPTTRRLHLTERFSRPNLPTLNYDATIDDPGAYTKPWSLHWSINQKTSSSWIAGGEMFEYICEDADQEGRN